MLGSRQGFFTFLGFGVAFILGACSSVNPPAENSPTDTGQPLELASCIRVNLDAPKVLALGRGLEVNIAVKNICDAEIQLPMTQATAFSEGKDTGVETSFNLSVTDAEPVGGGHTVRWMSTDTNRDYDGTMKTVTLAPGADIVRKLTWNGQLRNDAFLPSGSYLLVGSFDLTPAGVDNWKELIPERIRDIKTIFGEQPLEIVSD